MGDFCIALCGANGCIFVVKEHCEVEEDSNDSESDELLLKVIKSKLQVRNETRKCVIKSPSDDMNAVVIVYGTSDERKSIFSGVKDERRSYFLSFYNPIPLHILSSGLSDFMRKMDSSHPEAILAAWTDKNECELYSVNANGENYKCFGCVIGHQKEYIKEALLKIDFKALNVRQLLTDVVKIALEFCDEEDDLQVSWISDETNGKHQICDKKLVDDVMKSI
jgi:hypothetical protein